MHPKPKDKDMFLIVSRVCSTVLHPGPSTSCLDFPLSLTFFLDISSKFRDFCRCILERVAYLGCDTVKGNITLLNGREYTDWQELSKPIAAMKYVPYCNYYRNSLFCKYKFLIKLKII